MNNVCQVKEDILVLCDTVHCSSIYNGNKMSDAEWDLYDIVTKPKKAIEFSVAVVSCSIGIGAYNINETNNILFLKNTTTNVETAAVVTAGNYTITTLLDNVRGQISADYTLTYLSNRNKIFINCLTGPFEVLAKSTMWEPLGFQQNVKQTSVLNICLAPNCCNMSGIRTIGIYLDNVNTKNITTSTKTISTLIASIPCDVNSTGIVSYNLSCDYMVPCPINSLDYINLILKDQNGNLLENNGIHWSVLLKFSYYIEHEFINETINEPMNRNRQKIKIIQPKKIFTGIPNVFGNKTTLEE
jgi:hypothetical protein